MITIDYGDEQYPRIDELVGDRPVNTVCVDGFQ